MKRIFLILCALCLFPLLVGTTPNNTPPDEFFDQKIAEDPDRDRVLRESRRRFSGNTCEEELEDDREHDCKNLCSEIYNRSSDKEDCEELAVRQIELLSELHEMLENPYVDELLDIDLEDFEVYLNVSIEPFDTLTRRYKSRATKEIFLWVAISEIVAEIIEDEDDDYRNLASLLENLDSSHTEENVWKPFVENIGREDNLMEVAIQADNEVALEWFQDYINSQSICRDKTSVACFTVYCKLGDELNDDSREEWLLFENFQEYIDDIIDEGTNGCADPANTASCHWDTDLIEDESDVEDWVEELCGTLATI